MVNALTAAHGANISLECEFFALRVVALVIQFLQVIQYSLHPHLDM